VLYLAHAINTVVFVMGFVAILISQSADDLNMRYVSLCSRNDLISNTSVLLAAGAVHASGSMWPDLAVGVATAMLFLSSACPVLAAGRTEWQRTRRTSPKHHQVAE